MSHKATNWLASIDPALLGHSEFRVLFHLCDCHNPSQGCFPTQAYLMTNTGASNGTVNNALNSLEQKGLIQRHRSRDGSSKRQKPTRYVLGFEMAAKGKQNGKPTPKVGDGFSGEPTPNSGDGADSNLEADPSPIQRPTRLQPTGEEPVSKPVNNLKAPCGSGVLSKPAAFWIGKIRDGKFIPQNAISADLAAEIRGSGVLSTEELKHGHIAS